MDFTIGQIILTALDFAPTGSLACNGQSVAISSQPVLYDVIGTTYGGDGSTFRLPNIPPVRTTTGATLNWIIVTEGAPYASGMEALLSEVRLFAAPPPSGSTLAQSWMPCDGRLLSIDQNEPLFSLIGTTFGGDGVKTFALPILPLTLVSQGPAIPSWICTEGTFPQLGGDSRTPAPSDFYYDFYLGAVLQLALQTLTSELSALGLCLGQTIPIDQSWLPLFSLLATRYGGNRTSNYVLPSIQMSFGTINYAIVTNGLFPSRS